MKFWSFPHFVTDESHSSFQVYGLSCWELRWLLNLWIDDDEVELYSSSKASSISRNFLGCDDTMELFSGARALWKKVRITIDNAMGLINFVLAHLRCNKNYYSTVVFNVNLIHIDFVPTIRANIISRRTVFFFLLKLF